ncbi:hypothetical protein ACFSM7_14445 [Clavibacter michiganensis subsp. tessellarius]
MRVRRPDAATPGPTSRPARASGGDAMRRSACRYGVGMPPFTLSVSPIT